MCSTPFPSDVAGCRQWAVSGPHMSVGRGAKSPSSSCPSQQPCCLRPPPHAAAHQPLCTAASRHVHAVTGQGGGAHRGRHGRHRARVLAPGDSNRSRAQGRPCMLTSDLLSDDGRAWRARRSSCWSESWSRDYGNASSCSPAAEPRQRSVRLLSACEAGAEQLL
jgi:hypothetical protein